MSLGKTAVAFKSRIVHCPWELEGTSSSRVVSQSIYDTDRAAPGREGGRTDSTVFLFQVDSNK